MLTVLLKDKCLLRYAKLCSLLCIKLNVCSISNLSGFGIFKVGYLKNEVANKM